MTNFLPKLDILLFSTEKLNFHFLNSPIFGYCRRSITWYMYLTWRPASKKFWSLFNRLKFPPENFQKLTFPEVERASEHLPQFLACTPSFLFFRNKNLENYLMWLEGSFLFCVSWQQEQPPKKFLGYHVHWHFFYRERQFTSHHFPWLGKNCFPTILNSILSFTYQSYQCLSSANSLG